MLFLIDVSIYDENERVKTLSKDKRTLKLASDPLRCCKAREAINSCSSFTLTLTLPQERDIEEGGRLSCGDVEVAGVGAGGGGGG